MSAAKKFQIVSVGVEDGMVIVWALPKWLKTNLAATVDLTPQGARKLAIDLLKAAEQTGAES